MNGVRLLGIAALIGGKPHLRLNNGGRPIANKYREGKMERTLKRECQGLETVTREANCGRISGWTWSAVEARK